MTRGDKVTWLLRYRESVKDVIELEDRLEVCRTRATHITAGLSDTPSGGGKGDGLQRSVEEAAEIEEEIRRAKARAERIYQEIREQVSRVESPTLRSLLTYRYLERKTWEKVALTMGYCTMQIWRLHRQALDEIKM